MVEAGDHKTAQGVAERLAQVVRTELALELVPE
jgi:phosphoglucosamine mutase